MQPGKGLVRHHVAEVLVLDDNGIGKPVQNLSGQVRLAQGRPQLELLLLLPRNIMERGDKILLVPFGPDQCFPDDDRVTVSAPDRLEVQLVFLGQAGIEDEPVGLSDDGGAIRWEKLVNGLADHLFLRDAETFRIGVVGHHIAVVVILDLDRNTQLLQNEFRERRLFQRLLQAGFLPFEPGYVIDSRDQKLLLALNPGQTLVDHQIGDGAVGKLECFFDFAHLAGFEDILFDRPGFFRVVLWQYIIGATADGPVPVDSKEVGIGMVHHDDAMIVITNDDRRLELFQHLLGKFRLLQGFRQLVFPLLFLGDILQQRQNERGAALNVDAGLECTEKLGPTASRRRDLQYFLDKALVQHLLVGPGDPCSQLVFVKGERCLPENVVLRQAVHSTVGVIDVDVLMIRVLDADRLRQPVERGPHKVCFPTRFVKDIGLLFLFGDIEETEGIGAFGGNGAFDFQHTRMHLDLVGEGRVSVA